MQFTYSFSAKSLDKNGREAVKPTRGMVIASSLDLAYFKVKKNGFFKPYIKINLLETINTWLGAKVDQKELSRFYRTVGVRLGNNGSPLEAISAGQDFVTDKRLSSAIAIIKSSIEQGERIYEAMKIAGIDDRHCMMIKAMQEGGQTGKGFLDLSKEIADQEKLRVAISGMLRMLKIAVFGFYLFIPGLIFELAPKMLSFFEKVGKDALKIPDYVIVFYDFVRAANEYPPLFIVPYVVLPVLFISFLKSNLLVRILDKITLIKNFSIYAEHAQIWSIYGLLYRAGVRPDEIMDVLAKTVRRDETRDSISIFSKRIKAGIDENNAIQIAQFPLFVTSAYIAAKNSGSLADELINFSNNLKEDVEAMSSKIGDLVELFSKLVLGTIVVIVFMLVLYPIMGPMISSF
ncbi:type II secretion system F family protein [Polynucleobacter sp. JS-Safj-400b-B2]|uniref:type II secretion system F family protein n=1 Tax=Polynucleobacter sp. JS-Safj-400b-B2 TaxID=2576921 RepID=UPI001C0DE7B8|nr:type II secretion system F family protein [Polynucleobacter sp. JS-Safj-400b-B2]MBU3625880.1 type II secretion system F family protein [Polynucleobacter sp. JS-Safj-400b-B2]